MEHPSSIKVPKLQTTNRKPCTLNPEPYTVSAGAWDNAPSGCLFDLRGVFFNAHPEGGCSGACLMLDMAPICVRASTDNTGTLAIYCPEVLSLKCTEVLARNVCTFYVR